MAYAAIATQDITAEVRKSLAERALSLAYCQKGLGARDVHQLDFGITQFDVSTMSEESLLDLTQSSPAGEEKFDGLLPAVKADLARIEQRIKAAIGLRTKTRNGKAEC
jgi:hypothetical protein